MIENDKPDAGVEIADTIRNEMEQLADNIRDLVLIQPPIQLLGYLLAQFQMSVMLNPEGSEEEPRPNKDAVHTFQFALEYIHAIWSCHGPLEQEQSKFDENAAGELLNKLTQLQERTMMYCVTSSSSQTEFHAKTAWVMIRGHRYQVMEEEFFKFVFEPHDDALRKAYGIGSEEISSGIQNIANAFRTGLGDAVIELAEHIDSTYQEVEKTGETLETVIKRRSEEDSTFKTEATDTISDILFGGVCNLSRKSGLPVSVLEDISYEPGQNTAFFDEGPFSGTPMRTLPARIKPGIKLGDDFYATDGQFVRDSAYRAIQWGLWKRLSYRDEWLERQGKVVEQAFQDTFSNQIKGATIYESVFYRDVNTNQWVETDRLILLEDTLFVIEAKAGVMPMQSPAMNFKSHERVIQELIIKAYRQCHRFLDYLISAPEKGLFKLQDGEYVRIASIRKDQFRLIFPIGLTVEAFTPFSAMAKELPGVEITSGGHPFMSMSVDDLFVLRRFLPTTGELFHYFEVRQQVAGMRGALIFDEIDHLGAYITQNRFDTTIKEHLEDNDQVVWDGSSDIVDQFFEGENWQTDTPPAQQYPAELLKVLDALEEHRPQNWLKFDSALRNYGQSGRKNISKLISELEPTLIEHPQRRFSITEGEPLQVWMCREKSIPTPHEIEFQGQVACLTLGGSEVPVMVVAFSEAGKINRLICQTIRRPSVLLSNYNVIFKEAERQKARMINLT